MAVIERHRKICAPIRYRPFSDLLLRDAIDDGDNMRIGHVDEDLAGIRVDLEGFGVRLQRDVTNLAAGRRIDNGEAPAAVSNEDPVRRSIELPSSICPATL